MVSVPQFLGSFLQRFFHEKIFIHFKKRFQSPIFCKGTVERNSLKNGTERLRFDSVER